MKHIREIPDYVLSRDYDGKGVANPVSMIRAMKLAVGWQKGKNIHLRSRQE